MFSAKANKTQIPAPGWLRLASIRPKKPLFRPRKPPSQNSPSPGSAASVTTIFGRFPPPQPNPLSNLQNPPAPSPNSPMHPEVGHEQARPSRSPHHPQYQKTFFAKTNRHKPGPKPKSPSPPQPSPPPSTSHTTPGSYTKTAHGRSRTDAESSPANPARALDPASRYS